MTPLIFDRRSTWATRLLVLLSSVLLACLAAHADVIYTLNAVSQSGELFVGTLTFPAIPIPVPVPGFVIFTGQITQTTASGVIVDTYIPDESDVEGSVRRFLFEGTGQNGRENDGLYLYVEGSGFTSNLTVCTTTHICNCLPAATCPSPDPGNTISFSDFCNGVQGPDPSCISSDLEEFQTATLTGISTAATPEPSSLLLLTTGALCVPVIIRSGKRRCRNFRLKPLQ